MRRRVAVIGGGWAGLAAAVFAVEAEWQVTLFEMAPRLGGRARSLPGEGLLLDNGQHILIGAYVRTLALMRRVGVDVERSLLRIALTLRDANGHGVELSAGPPAWSALRGLLLARGWPLADRIALVRWCLRWAIKGFRCDPAWTVEQLAHTLPRDVCRQLVEPLCVAAMNTPASQASAAVFLRVLHDALLAERGGSDMLLPRVPLDDLLPRPAASWLTRHGAELHTGTRVGAIDPADAGWQVDGERFDAVLLCTSAVEAARLCSTLDPRWAERARAMTYEPIVTVYVQARGARLSRPIVAMRDGPERPAQFVLDHGQIGGRDGLLACVISGAAPWVERGLQRTGEQALEQLRVDFGPARLGASPAVLRAVAERRATFRCTPQLDRPRAQVAPALFAAGDYVAGPYPATLEGAVRSAHEAVTALVDSAPP